MPDPGIKHEYLYKVQRFKHSYLKKSEIYAYKTYSHGQELFHKFLSKITNKLVKQLMSMTVSVCCA